jgi:hypothetical protein
MKFFLRLKLTGSFIRFFEKVNMCFPIFDEVLFRRLFVTHKERISPGLLSNLYGNTLIYWNSSPRLSNVPRLSATMAQIKPWFII